MLSAVYWVGLVICHCVGWVLQLDPTASSLYAPPLLSGEPNDGHTAT